MNTTISSRFSKKIGASRLTAAAAKLNKRKLIIAQLPMESLRRSRIDAWGAVLLAAVLAPLLNHSSRNFSSPWCMSNARPIVT